MYFHYEPIEFFAEGVYRVYSEYYDDVAESCPRLTKSVEDMVNDDASYDASYSDNHQTEYQTEYVQNYETDYDTASYARVYQTWTGFPTPRTLLQPLCPTDNLKS